MIPHVSLEDDTIYLLESDHGTRYVRYNTSDGDESRSRDLVLSISYPGGANVEEIMRLWEEEYYDLDAYDAAVEIEATINLGLL